MQRLLDVSAQLQQSQADFMGSQRRSAELQEQVAASQDKVQSLEKIKTQLTQASPAHTCNTSLVNVFFALEPMLISMACLHVAADVHRDHQSDPNVASACTVCLSSVLVWYSPSLSQITATPRMNLG